MGKINIEIDIDNFLGELCEIEPKYKRDVEALEEKYFCEISHDTEKHNSLQYTYFYEVDFGLEELLFVEIESGINNGTQVNHAEWGVDSKEDTKLESVLKDIVLDMEYYERGSVTAKKAQEILDSNKNKLFEFHRKNNYDNYVTGGNSRLKLDPLLSGLRVNYVYELTLVDRNFV